MRKGNSQGTSFSGGLLDINRRKLVFLGLSFIFLFFIFFLVFYFFNFKIFLKAKFSLFLNDSQYATKVHWVIWNESLSWFPFNIPPWNVPIWDYRQDQNDDCPPELCRTALFCEKKLCCIHVAFIPAPNTVPRTPQQLTLMRWLILCVWACGCPD